jgi:hypothetical protein
MPLGFRLQALHLLSYKQTWPFYFPSHWAKSIPSHDSLAGFYFWLGLEIAKFQKPARLGNIAKNVSFWLGMVKKPSRVWLGKLIIPSHGWESLRILAKLLFGPEKIDWGSPQNICGPFLLQEVKNRNN